MCGVHGVIGRMFLAQCVYSRVVVYVYRQFIMYVGKYKEVGLYVKGLSRK